MKRALQVLLAIQILLAAPAVSTAETITVTTSADPIDIDWQTATIEDLPGPDGEVSFSEAMIAAGNTPGHDTIGFAIPEGEWPFQFLFPGRAVVVTSYSYFWRAYEAVTIDGTTQTTFTGDTNPAGAEVVLFGGELYLNADGCTLIGLDSSAVTFTGSSGLAQGNTGTTSLTFFSGGGSLVQGNAGSTLKIDRSNGNVVVGNTFQRLRVLGFAPDQPAAGNQIGGPAAEDRNYFTGLGSTNSEGLPSGYSIQLFDTFGTLIENNSIGSTPDGLQSGSTLATMGIRIEGDNRDVVVRGNRIAGVLGIGQGPHHAGQLFGWAIHVSGSGSGLDITGNTIGLNADGEPTLGSVTGIDVGTWAYAGLSDIRIGGPNPGEGNVIAGHRFNGVTVGREVAQVRISGNSIYANEDLGIDLIPTGYGYGVTPNDPLDADTGGNGLQNFPVIESATSQSGALRVIGSLQSSPASEFTLEFLATPACDPNGHGEGQVFLGSATVSTDGAGQGAFDLFLDASPEEGWAITATATTEPLGATSEFSACVPVEGTASAAASGDSPVRAGGTARILASAPNPFVWATAIRYEVPRAGAVELAIYDASGRLIRSVVDGELPAGVHAVDWDGRSDSGEEVAGGVYFCRLRVGGESHARPVVLAR